jgi:putative endopeptidase
MLRKLARTVSIGFCLAGSLIAGSRLTADAWGADPADKTAGSKSSGIELDYVSKTLKPADNFYEYVNEGWLKTTEIPADQSNYGSFSRLDDDAKAAIRQLIEEAAASRAPAGSDQQKVGDFYSSYINTELRDQLGTAPIRPLLKEVDAAQDPQAVAKLVARLLRVGIAGPLALYISVDAKKSDQYTVYVTQSGTTLPDRDYYLKDDPQYQSARDAFRVYIADMLRLFEHSNPEAAAKRILDLETKLAEMQWTRVANRDPNATYNKLSRSELAGMLDQFDIGTFLDALELKEQSEFVVRQPSYVQGVNGNIPSIPLETWHDYYKFRIIDSFAVDLSQEIEKRHFEFHKTALSGIEEQLPLWRRGVEASNGILGEVVGKLYVDKYFPPEAKARMEELVDNLKKAFAKRIVELEWMSPVTKKQAHEKLSKFTTKIGYPDKWKDYSALEIKPDDLVGNYMRAAEVEYRRQLEKLGPSGILMGTSSVRRSRSRSQF